MNPGHCMCHEDHRQVGVHAPDCVESRPVRVPAPRKPRDEERPEEPSAERGLSGLSVASFALAV